MTDEPAKDTEAFVAATEMKYAYAYDKGGKLANWAGVSGIPHAILLNAAGKIVWEGGPGSLDEKTIQGALVGAMTKPVWDWPASAKDVRAALLKRNYADALAKADKVSSSEGGAEIKNGILSLVKSRVAVLQSTYEAGDLLGASEQAASLTKQLDGLPEKAEAEKVAAAIKANNDSSKVIAAQKKLAELREKRIKKRELDAVIGDLKKLAKEFDGGYVAKEAEALMKELLARQKKDS